MQYVCKYISPLGTMTLAANGDALTGAWFDGQKYFASTLTSACEEAGLPVFRQAKAWLERYFSGQNPGETPAVHLEGSPFRMTVWNILREIPYGRVITYGDIARRIAFQTGKARMSAQAVGGAVGHNPVSIFIPCHRVVGSNGSLTGYAGGLSVKGELLRLEGVANNGLSLLMPVRAEP